MTYMESEIIFKKVDVKCHIIKVILFCVKVLLIAEVRKKEESDIRLNNPDLLRAVVTFTSIRVRDRLLKIA